jgi:hypothetical protein
MADVETGDILRLGALLDFEGVYDIVNVWHVKVTEGGGIDWATATLRIQSYLDMLYDEIKASLSEAVGTGAISVANVTQSTTLGSIPWSPTWAGTGAGDYTAPGVCLFAWGRTLTPRVQIRKYFGVFPEGALTDGVFITAPRVAVQALMDIHIEDTFIAAGTNFQGVAYNRTLLTHKTAVSADTSAEPAYQRRRKRGRGS